MAGLQNIVPLAGVACRRFPFLSEHPEGWTPNVWCPRFSVSFDYDRFNALSTARTEASSMFVSTPAPQRDLPSACLI